MKNNMKKHMHIFKRFILLFICAVLVFSLFSCGYDYQDESNAIRRFMIFHDKPENLIIDTLEKYEISENEIFYFVKWRGGEEDENDTSEAFELLVVYNPQSTLIELEHFQDMEQGFSSDTKSKWDEVKNNPTRKFSPDEIKIIMRKAIGLFKADEALK